MNTNKVETRLREIAERENKATSADYDPLECLSAEVERFKATNQFTPMLVTGFYLQAACVITELRAARKLIKKQREALEADALADKLFERAEAHREESIACGYDNDPTGSLAVTESYKAANAQALIATQLKRDALNFSPENL